MGLVTAPQGRKRKLLRVEDLVAKINPADIDEDYLFELCYVVLVLNIAKDEGITDAELIRRAFRGDNESSRKRALAAMKGTTITGKPQRLRLGDAHAMARALGQEFAGLVYGAQYKMRDLDIFKDLKRRELNQ